MIVDGHVHLFAPVSGRRPRETSALFPATARAEPAELRAAMDRAGVDRAVVVALSPPDEYLLECIAAHEDAFVGVGVFGGEGPEGVAERRRAGVRGLRVFQLGPHGRGDGIPPASMETLATMADVGMVLWLYVAEDQMPMIAEVARALPRLQIVLNHLGFPRCPTTLGRDGLPHSEVTVPPPSLAAMLELAGFENVAVMTSGEYAFGVESYPFRDVAVVVRRIHERFGAARMLWASDHPWAGRHLGYERLLDLPRIHLPDASADELELIMGGTASRIFGL